MMKEDREIQKNGNVVQQSYYIILSCTNSPANGDTVNCKDVNVLQREKIIIDQSVVFL